MGIHGTQSKKSKTKKIICLVTAVLICATAATLYTRLRDYTFPVMFNGEECSYTGQKNFAGKMHGDGTLTLADGLICHGEWKNGVLISEGTLTFPNGSQYEGEVDGTNYLPKGTGTFYYKDQNKAPLSGENWTWIEEKPLNDDQHSIGTERKVFYTGMWLDNQYSGYGCRYTVNSDEHIINRYTGEFRKNYCYGEVTDRWMDYCEITLQYDFDGEEDGNSDDTAFSDENATFHYLNANYEPVTGSYRFVEKAEFAEGTFAGLGIIRNAYIINNELLAGSIYFYNGTNEKGNPKYSRYHGTFSDGNIVGKGKFEFVDGTSVDLDNVAWLKSQTRSSGIYTGMISNGEYIGFGTLVKDSGATYRGEFREGNYNGKGTYTYAENDESQRAKYEGSFVNGEREGKGSLTWKDGAVYDGSYVSDKRSEGIQKGYHENGNLRYLYDGQYKDGEFSEGSYKRYYDNGNLDYRYTGTYDENGKYSGNDCKYESYYEDGTLYCTYTGQYKTGEFSDGTYERYYKNGNLDYRYTGTYDENGKRSGNDCKYEKYNEDSALLYTYEGSYKSDRKNGYGTFTWKNNDFYRQYAGNYVDDEYEGEGTLYWISGAVYTGGWHNGTYHGFGTYTFPDGSLLTGQWINGEFQD